MELLFLALVRRVWRVGWTNVVASPQPRSTRWTIHRAAWLEKYILQRHSVATNITDKRMRGVWLW